MYCAYWKNWQHVPRQHVHSERLFVFGSVLLWSWCWYGGRMIIISRLILILEMLVWTCILLELLWRMGSCGKSFELFTWCRASEQWWKVKLIDCINSAIFILTLYFQFIDAIFWSATPWIKSHWNLKKVWWIVTRSKISINNWWTKVLHFAM